MTLQEAMAELERLGTETWRGTLLRHGVEEPLFGVRQADLEALARRIGNDTDLARTLWITGNHDARVLATLVARPEDLTPTELSMWVAETSDDVLNGAVSAAAGRSPQAQLIAEAWRHHAGEWVSAAGWNVVAQLAESGAAVSDAWLGGCLAEIERDIHTAPNRTRHSMNGALIAIGGGRPALTPHALAAAEAIGTVDVDHGRSRGETPDAAAHIRKRIARAAAAGAVAITSAPRKPAARRGKARAKKAAPKKKPTRGRTATKAKALRKKVAKKKKAARHK